MALTDSDIHEPPMTGLYHYNTWTPANGSFPAVGGSYIDPIFGSTVRRMTNTYAAGEPNAENIYGHHWANADGTLCFSQQYITGEGTFLYILDTTTGERVYSDQPSGNYQYELNWHPTDPDKYYYLSGASLVRRNLAAQTTTTIKTFPSTLFAMGGSLDWTDKTGRYFLVNYGGASEEIVHLWDSQTDTIYTGTVTMLSVGAGWVTITPDGNYIVSVGGTTPEPDREHYSYAINHGTQTIGSPVQFWGISGDHVSVVSASDGHNYMIGGNTYDNPGIWRVDITLNQAGRTAAQQEADNLYLFPLPWTASGHQSSGVGDWSVISIEDGTDEFDEAPTGWYAYENEILRVNVVTLEIQRLAHSRGRSQAVNYYYQSRVSSSWDGSVIMWTSNYNISTLFGGLVYADLYVVNVSSSQKHCLVLK